MEKITRPEETDVHQIRVLVVYDHDIVRRGIRSLLSGDSELDIICETSTGEEAVAKAQEHSPDIVLLDIRLPGINGLEAARRIRAVSPRSHILFMSQYDSQEMVQEAFRAGGTGYLLKAEAARELSSAIRAVLGGTRYLSKSITFAGQSASQSASQPRVRSIP
jgi:DNA-binding NarL/FixJ family response regulator